MLGPRRKRQRSTACRVRPAADLAAAAEQTAAAAHKVEKVTAQQLGVAAKTAEAARQEANPTRVARAPSCTQWPSTQPLAL